jgi:isopenicillin-N epimerase
LFICIYKSGRIVYCDSAVFLYHFSLPKCFAFSPSTNQPTFKAKFNIYGVCHLQSVIMNKTHLKDYFLLDPEFTFLNHGSFGATPKPVFDVYQQFQRELEHQPVHFIQKRLPDLLAESRHALGAYLAVHGDNLIYTPNPTAGVNMVVKSLDLGPGDEVLTTDIEYGACDNCLDFYAGKKGYRVVRQTVTLPAQSADSLLDEIWSGVTPNTKVIFISHITSATAMRLPAEELCHRARAAGIITIIDGAHAPAHIELDLSSFDPDFYVGACHKWMCAPKGTAFLYARPDQQPMLEPLVVGWGYGAKPNPDFGSTFLNIGSWLGTRDLAAYYTIPAAIAFQKEHNWDSVRDGCTELLNDTLARIDRLTGMLSMYPAIAPPNQLGIAKMRSGTDPLVLKDFLFDRKIEIPTTTHQNDTFVRVSVQGYNDQEDYDRLLAALGEWQSQ